MRLTTPLYALTRAALACCVLGTAALSRAGEPWPVPADAAAIASPLEADDRAAVAAGEKSYFAKCVMCHGDTGAGDGISSGYLPVPPGNLTSKVTQAQSDGALFYKLTEGRVPMPGFRDKLAVDERWQLVMYMRTLAAVEPDEAKPHEATADEAKPDAAAQSASD